MRFANFMISLPLLLCVAQATKPVTYAQAATLDASQATQLLAKANALNGKCSILAPDKSQDLKDYVARAELSLAEKVSVSVARKAVSEGRASGKAALCDEAATKLVNDVLGAASIAATAAPIENNTVETEAPQTQPEPQVAAEEQPEPQALAVAEPEPAPVVQAKPIIIKPKKKTKAVVAAKNPQMPLKAPKGLGGYANVAETYYVALRCGGVRPGKLNQMYKTVLANHNQALANNRPREVRAMLRAAEARAGSRSCS